ncbi:MAG: hypothetical protein AMXMBFR57_36270 [Acidimicrobiia bacterium]
MSFVVRALDALTGGGLAGVTVEGDGFTAAASDGSGQIRLTVNAEHSGDQQLVRFVGSSIVPRESLLRVPGADAEIDLIPASFDLDAFNQIARQPATKRWMTPPVVVVEQRVLQFDALDKTSWTPTATVKDAGYVQGLMSDLSAGLVELTGGVIPSFERQDTRTSPGDAPIPITVSNQITVFWVEGLARHSGYDGYARWEYRNWVLTGGVILLDVDADRGSASRWLRFHELGHTLGFTHVVSRPSLMAPSAQPMTEFDRHAGRLLYSRLPGNRAPDIDPDPTSLNRTAAPRWSSWMGTRLPRR